jgi:hypothetical protein
MNLWIKYHLNIAQTGILKILMVLNNRLFNILIRFPYHHHFVYAFLHFVVQITFFLSRLAAVMLFRI